MVRVACLDTYVDRLRSPSVNGKRFKLPVIGNLAERQAGA